MFMPPLYYTSHPPNFQEFTSAVSFLRTTTWEILKDVVTDRALEEQKFAAIAFAPLKDLIKREPN